MNKQCVIGQGHRGQKKGSKTEGENEQIKEGQEEEAWEKVRWRSVDLEMTIIFDLR